MRFVSVPNGLMLLLTISHVSVFASGVHAETALSISTISPASRPDAKSHKTHSSPVQSCKHYIDDGRWDQPENPTK
jgi:hypothetical protein